MSILYTGTLLEPQAQPKGYQYPPNDYDGPIRFDRIDDQIAWAEQESRKGEDSHWHQESWYIPMRDIGRDHEASPVIPPTNDVQGIEECGTAFCLAGSAAVVAGWKPAFVEGRASWGVVVKGEEQASSAVAALQWFGFDVTAEDENNANSAWSDTWAARRMFSGSNDIRSIKSERDNLARSVGFPARWFQGVRPYTYNLDRARSLRPEITSASLTLDRLQSLGVLSLGDHTPDEILAKQFDIDLKELELEKKQLAAWEAAAANLEPLYDEDEEDDEEESDDEVDELNDRCDICGGASH